MFTSQQVVALELPPALARGTEDSVQLIESSINHINPLSPLFTNLNFSH